MAETHAAVRKHVYFSWETWTKLIDFMQRKYGRQKGLSLTVDRAVREFLARDD